MIAARSRPSQREAADPTLTISIVCGSPIGLPEASSTQQARCPLLRSTPSTGPTRNSVREAGGSGLVVQDASRYQRSRSGFVADVVTHRAAGADSRRPLIATVTELDRGLDCHMGAELVCQRGRGLDA